MVWAIFIQGIFWYGIFGHGSFWYGIFCPDTEYSTDIISQRRIAGHCASSPECFEHSLKNTKKDFF